MHRPTIGVVAVLLIAAGVAGQFMPALNASWQPLAYSCWRVGLVLGVLWFAQPQLERMARPWMLGAFLVTAVVVAARPTLVLHALVVWALLLVLLPRRKRPPP